MNNKSITADPNNTDLHPTTITGPGYIEIANPYGTKMSDVPVNSNYKQPSTVAEVPIHDSGSSGIEQKEIYELNKPNAEPRP
ncbi:MAG: hypothetical protein WC856_10055 [Methylococcaceae bacterium]|jgi:hypothetical protein